MKALIVDDASFVRDLIKRTLRSNYPKLGWEEAVNGKKAQAMMSRGSFDLVLCDWEMPEMSGLELLQWARSEARYEETPFIMITSRGDKSNVVEAIQSGVSDYLGKPFSEKQLSLKIAKAMKGKTGEAESTAPATEDAFMQSAALLTGGSAANKAAASKKTVASASLVRTPETLSPGNKAAPASTTGKSAAVRFSSGELSCQIKSVTLTEVKVIAGRSQSLPQIMESAVVDIEFEPGNMARLNGYVHQMQAVEKRKDAQQVSIVIRFVDEDPEKMEHLSRFMARFR